LSLVYTYVEPGSPSITDNQLTEPPIINQTGQSNDTNINGTTTVTIFSDGLPAPGISIGFSCISVSDECVFFYDTAVTDENGQLNVTLQSPKAGPKQVTFTALVDQVFLTMEVGWTVSQLVQCQGMDMSLFSLQNPSFYIDGNVTFYVGQRVEAAVLPYDLYGDTYGLADLTVAVVVDDQTSTEYGNKTGPFIAAPATTPSSVVTATYFFTFNTCPIVTQTATWLWGIDCSSADIVESDSNVEYDEGEGLLIYQFSSVGRCRRGGDQRYDFRIQRRRGHRNSYNNGS
jgi:hypothetical protein